MKINPTRLWIAAILLGWIFDFLFWEQDAGINFASFLTLSLILGTGLLLADGFRPAPRSLWLLVPFAFFAVVTFLRREPLTIFLGYAFSLFSLGVFVVTYLGGRWTLYGLTDYFRRFFQLIANTISLPTRFVRETKQEQIADGTRRFPFIPILRGLLIALPIVAVFASLLAGADAIFDQRLDRYFEDFDLFEEIQRGLIILAIAYLLAGTFLYAAFHSRDESVTDSEKPRKHPLGFTEAAIVLGSVALLFGFFVAIQFQYFFGGQTNIGETGFTYSEYARRGFNELITVAFFCLVMILGLGILTRRESEVERRVYSGLSVVIVAEVMVMLVSAWQRLMLGIDWHGYSRLRLYPSIFMIWLGILLAVVVILEIMRRERYFALAFVLASLGFGISLTFVSVDAAIVTHNLERVAQGKNLNVPHLASLSSDAVPALVDLFNDPSYSTETHEGVGAILMCYIYSIRPDREVDWRAFNVSSWRARQALKQIQPLLADYHYNDKKGPPRVRTPGNTLYPCVDETGSDIAD